VGDIRRLPAFAIVTLQLTFGECAFSHHGAEYGAGVRVAGGAG
jgi:hypothetical protein